jgi:uncharacterized spore protein YtfJ
VIDTFGRTVADPQAVRDMSHEFVEKIFAAAQPGTVFSAPVISGDYTIITAGEVMAGGGFGFGYGSGSIPTPEQQGGEAGPAPTNQDGAGSGSGGGGGGGGGSSGRPVAAIIIGPDGVKVEPVVDATKIALAAIGAWLSIALLLARRARATRS